MVKTNVCVLFGGVSPEHEVSLRSAESVLNHLDPEKYNVLPVGITKEGNWVLYGGSDYSKLPTNEWLQCPDNRRAFISPIHGQGLVIIDGDRISKTAVDVIFPVLHGENGEDGTVQGLFQLAGIPYVGCGVASSASCMDKCLTKLTAEKAQVRQADWELVTRLQLRTDPEAALDRVERRFTYPVFVKPAGTGSSVGVSKARSRAALLAALENAVRFDRKVLVEEFICGREVEVAVLGNEQPIASVPGEIDAGAEFYDYETKYVTSTSRLFIPARISEAASERVRSAAVKVYQAMGCRGLSRVDFFVTYEDEAVVFNEINTLPGFTSISMYPKLFAASGIPYGELLDRLIALAREAFYEA